MPAPAFADSSTSGPVAGVSAGQAYGLGGAGLSAGLANWSGGAGESAGLPVRPGGVGLSDRVKKLKKALVTEKDLPSGFQEQEDDYLVTMFRAMLGERRPGADPCAVPAAAKRPPADPVKAGEPRPVVAKKPAGPPGAAALFLHDAKSMVAVETLAITGEETAVDLVADLDMVLEKCPTAEAAGVKLTMRALDWDPPLGDESRTVGMVMAMNLDGVEMTMHGKLAQVAYRDVSMAVGLIGASEPADRHLKKITNAAVRKLVTSADLFTEADTQKP